MHLKTLSLLFCSVSLLWLPTTAAGQAWSMPWSDPRDRPPRVDFNASAGFLLPSDWSDLVLLGTISSATGVLEQVLVRDLSVEPGPIFGGAVTYWRSKYGFRVHAARAESSLTIGGNDPASVDLDTWMYDVRGAIGLIDYTPGRWLWPYVFFGFGGITYDLARTVSPPLLTFIEQRPGRPPRSDLVIIDDAGRQFLLTVDELRLETVFAINFGVGADFRIPLGPAGVALRLEISDHVAHSPLAVRLHQLGSFGVPPSHTLIRFGQVHHLRAAAGLVVQIGR